MSLNRPTSIRVEAHSPSCTERIRRQTEANLGYFARNPEHIEGRLCELEREWDIERALQANAGAIAGGTFLLGRLGARRLSWFPGIVAGFLLQHALTGWCPPVGVFRRLGYRTAREIGVERVALQALRGDFEDLRGQTPEDRAADALAVAEDAFTFAEEVFEEVEDEDDEDFTGEHTESGVGRRAAQQQWGEPPMDAPAGLDRRGHGSGERLAGGLAHVEPETRPEG